MDNMTLAIAVIELLTGIVIGITAFSVKRSIRLMDSLKDSLDRLSIRVAEDYAKRADLQKLEDMMRQRFHDLLNGTISVISRDLYELETKVAVLQERHK